MTQAKLHIRSDSSEEAEMILEPGDPEEHGTLLRLHDNYHHISVDSRGVMEIAAGSNNLLGIDASNLVLGGKPAGIYLLRLSSQRETKVWKIIKRN